MQNANHSQWQGKNCGKAGLLNMTESEAIKDIKENILPSADGKSLILAISALEKQIADKLRYIN